MTKKKKKYKSKQQNYSYPFGKSGNNVFGTIVGGVIALELIKKL